MAAVKDLAAGNFTSTTTPFEHREYDVTNLCAKFCPPGSLLTCCTERQRLILEPEEAVLVSSNCCATANQRRPYGELGSVDKITACGICATFQFGNATVSPGCSCSGALVEEIVAELKARMKARGDTGQIVRAEEQLTQIHQVKADLANVNAKLDALLRHLAIPTPDPVASARAIERG